MTAASDKSGVERLLDVALYAPLGFALSADDTVAQLAAKGRKQIAFSRTLGKAALRGLARNGAPSAASPAGGATKKAPPASKKAKAPMAKKSKAPASPKPSKTGAASKKAETAKKATSIAGYDDMTAREIITLVPTLSSAQASWVRTQEASGKARVTVLRALDAKDAGA